MEGDSVYTKKILVTPFGPFCLECRKAIPKTAQNVLSHFATHHEQMYEDMSKEEVCSKYGSGAVYTDYGLVAVRSFKEPEVKKEAPKKTRKKASEE